jgi:hypothetical protein
MIHPDADLAEYIAAQFKRDAAQHPRVEIRADFNRRAFYLQAPSGEPIGKLYHQYKHAVLARNWLATEVRS